ncbi:MAG: hypothetical protein A4E73_01405 [Syntrophaceae bacterium PtaU1.Bin231]|nr:MAG: hypothetical protein A4E73_01405 [Syntrophaceae bacterium PtaU1.Bin231]
MSRRRLCPRRSHGNRFREEVGPHGRQAHSLRLPHPGRRKRPAYLRNPRHRFACLQSEDPRGGGASEESHHLLLRAGRPQSGHRQGHGHSYVRHRRRRRDGCGIRRRAERARPRSPHPRLQDRRFSCRPHRSSRSIRPARRPHARDGVRLCGAETPEDGRRGATRRKGGGGDAGRRAAGGRKRDPLPDRRLDGGGARRTGRRALGTSDGARRTRPSAADPAGARAPGDLCRR